MKNLILLALLLGKTIIIYSQTPFMVKDINPGTPQSFISNLTKVNNTLFFAAYTSAYGLELWKSDGTSTGTVMVKDINAGTNNSTPSKLTNANGTLFFRANDGINGPELWKSDVTEAGTVLVKNIRPNNTDDGISHIEELSNVGNLLFFAANDGVNDYALWKSDGTETGTVMVKDINPTTQLTSLGRFINIDGTLFFGASDGVNGHELWKSDGTETGTVMVKDIATGSQDGFTSYPYMTNVNGTLFFVANDGKYLHERELWKSDGTEAGTTMVKDIYPGDNGITANSSVPWDLKNVNGTLFFQAQDGINGSELWKSDGTEFGTVIVKDIKSGILSSNPNALSNCNGTLYFQAVDSSGIIDVWKSDGEFGAIMTWVDNRNGNWDIYSQRINEAGIPLWANNGIVICDAQNFQNKPRIIPYQNNGAIISWTDRRNNSTNDDIYTQRIDGNGTIQWAYNGIPVCTDCIESFSTTSIPQIVADNTTQEIFYTWPNLDANETDIYAQKLNSNGIPLWSTNGIPICTSPNIQSKQKSVLDNTGGIIVCWEDNRTNTGNNIFAQRINALGYIQWALNGIEICNAAGYEQNPYMLADGNGGAYIAWEDERFFVKDIYAQRINNNGISQWQANGIPICTATGIQSGPAIKTISPSSIVIAWEDNRNGSGDIYAQQITNNGNILWALNGVIITNATGYQYSIDVTNSDTNNLLFAWEDNRNGPTDVYATKLNANGTLTNTSNSYNNQIRVYPNPSTNFINIKHPNNIKINKYIISDLSGKNTLEYNDSNGVLNLSKLNKGIYILQMHSNYHIFTTKIIKY